VGSRPESGVDPRNKLNDLTGKVWIQSTRSWSFQKGLGQDHVDTEIERQHPAPFSYKDVEKFILMFTKPGMTVLDPFCGVASTLKAAALNGRNAVGIEISTKWTRLGKERMVNEVPEKLRKNLRLKIVRGDCIKELPKLEARTVDFIVTSPPYWRILNKCPDHKVREKRIEHGLATKYSSSPSDLGNIDDYEEFLKRMKVVLRLCRRALKDEGYMVLIVGDFRDGSRYIPYHMHVAQLAESVGMPLAGITVLIQNGKQLYPYGYPFSYVPNIHHQYALIIQRRNGEAR